MSSQMDKLDPTRLVLKILLIITLTITNVLLVISISSMVPMYLFVRLMAKVFRPDLGPIVNDVSSVFTIYKQAECGANLNHFLILDGSMTCARFAELFDQRVMQCKGPDGQLFFPRFRYSWTEFMGYSFWRPETNYRTEDHVRDYDLKGEWALPSPCYEEDLRRVMGSIAGKPWPEDQSPWEALLIQNYRTPGDNRAKTVIVLSHHHALIDGYGLVSLMRSLFESNYSLPSLTFPKVPLWYRILAPWKMGYDLTQMLADCLDGEEKWHVPLTAPREMEASFTKAIPIETVKRIKNKLKVSYTAVLFAAVAGAIERMAKEDEKKKKNVPEFLGVHFPLPKRDHPGGSVNHAYLVGSQWEIKNRSPIWRARSIDDKMRWLSRSTVPEMGEWASWGVPVVPNFIREVFMDRLGAGGSIGISCFPATADQVTFDGLKINDLISCIGAMGHLGIVVLITGLNGNQRVALTGNKHIFSPSSINKLGRYVEEELDALAH